ncbi:MAG: DMT family transporter [Ignavibacteriaceae bacterium]|nr:DMT family transporter [Ignavibacteriaceae bacterium]
MKSLKKYLSEGALLVNTIIWGGTFALIKNALPDISPSIFLAVRFSIAALILLPFVFRQIVSITKPAFISGIVLGIFYFLGFAAQTIGLKFTTATKSGFITGTFVVIIPVLQLLIERRTPRWHNFLSILLVLLGLIFLSSKGENIFSLIDELGADFNLGDLLTLICAVLFAFQVVYVDVFTKRFDYLPLVFLQLAITGIGGAVFTFIFSLTGIEIINFTFSGSVLIALVYTVIFASVAATIIQLKFQKEVSPTKAGIIFSFEPIMAAIFAFFILNEKISNFGLLGCILIFIGLLLSEILDKKDG